MLYWLLVFWYCELLNVFYERSENGVLIFLIVLVWLRNSGRWEGRAIWCEPSGRLLHLDHLLLVHLRYHVNPLQLLQLEHLLLHHQRPHLTDATPGVRWTFPENSSLNCGLHHDDNGDLVTVEYPRMTVAYFAIGEILQHCVRQLPPVHYSSLQSRR